MNDPPTGGSHGKPHRTTKILGDASRRRCSGVPLAARAQQPASRPLIGSCRRSQRLQRRATSPSFGPGCVTLAIRYAEGMPERLPPLAAELAALKPRVILAGSQSGALAAPNATRTISLVVITSDDPIATGLVNSFARPGGNVTGTWTAGDDAVVGKRLERLQCSNGGPPCNIDDGKFRRPVRGARDDRRVWRQFRLLSLPCCARTQRRRRTIKMMASSGS
jgi:hypothetical protein